MIDTNPTLMSPTARLAIDLMTAMLKGCAGGGFTPERVAAEALDYATAFFKEAKRRGEIFPITNPSPEKPPPNTEGTP